MVATKFSSSFFKQFDLAMKLKMGRTEKTRKKQHTGQHEITEGDLIQAFGVYRRSNCKKAAAMLGMNEKTENLGNSSA